MTGEQWTCFEPDRPSGWDERDFARFVERHAWRYARTMPRNPHEYTLRRDTSGAAFDAAVRYIREHGRVEPFGGKPYKTLYSGDRKYWTMGAPLSDTILINRKLLAGGELADSPRGVRTTKTEGHA
jgi:hypothetical protein